MNDKYYVSLFSDKPVLYKKLADKTKVVLFHNEKDIKENMLNLIDIDNCIVKVYSKNNVLVLQDVETKSFISIKNFDKLYRKREFKDIVEKILAIIETKGYIDMDKKKNAKNVKRNTGRNGKIIKYLTVIVAGLVTILTVDLSTRFVYNPVSHELEASPFVTESTTLSEDFYEEDLTSSTEPSETINVENPEIIEPIVVSEPVNSNSSIINPVMDNPVVSEPVSMDESHDIVYLDFEDISDSDKAVSAKENFYPLIQKYSELYGLDPDMVLAMATQERGSHGTEIDDGGAIGLMQIQRDQWINKSIIYYELDANTGRYVQKSTPVITDEMIKDLEWNIKLGCILVQDGLVQCKYNIPLAIQSYNMGDPVVRDIVRDYANASGKTTAQVYADQCDIGWINFCEGRRGDSEYLMNINKWADKNKYTVTNVFTGAKVTVEFTNSNEIHRNTR